MTIRLCYAFQYESLGQIKRSVELQLPHALFFTQLLASVLGQTVKVDRSRDGHSSDDKMPRAVGGTPKVPAFIQENQEWIMRMIAIFMIVDNAPPKLPVSASCTCDFPLHLDLRDSGRIVLWILIQSNRIKIGAEHTKTGLRFTVPKAAPLRPKYAERTAGHAIWNGAPASPSCPCANTLYHGLPGGCARAYRAGGKTRWCTNR